MRGMEERMDGWRRVGPDSRPFRAVFLAKRNFPDFD